MSQDGAQFFSARGSYLYSQDGDALGLDPSGSELTQRKCVTAYVDEMRTLHAGMTGSVCLQSAVRVWCGITVMM